MNLSETIKIHFSKKLLVIPVALALSVNVHARELKAALPMQSKGDSVYAIVDKMPEFPGGETAIIDFVRNKIKYPSKALKNNESGKVVVQFVVGKTGKVENPVMLKGVSPSLDKEAMRVISLLPDWIPGKQDSANVAVSMVIPVMFKNTNDSAQWEPNNKTVVVIDDLIMPAHFRMEILNPNKFTSVNILKPFPKEKVKNLKNKYGKQAANGVLLITTNKDEMYYALADSVGSLNPITDCKEPAVLPQFPGGKEKMFSYIADSIQYPFIPKQLKKQGKVAVRFRVNKAGKVSDAVVAQSLDYFLDKEALRVINSMPAWIPGAKCEQKLDIYVTMPVTFKLDLSASEKSWERNDKTIILLNGKRIPSGFDLKLLSYANLTSYQVLEPATEEITKKLKRKYGKDAMNGVVLIETQK